MDKLFSQLKLTFSSPENTMEVEKSPLPKICKSLHRFHSNQNSETLSKCLFHHFTMATTHQISKFMNIKLGSCTDANTFINFSKIACIPLLKFLTVNLPIKIGNINYWKDNSIIWMVYRIFIKAMTSKLLWNIHLKRTTTIQTFISGMSLFASDCIPPCAIVSAFSKLHCHFCIAILWDSVKGFFFHFKFSTDNFFFFNTNLPLFYPALHSCTRNLFFLYCSFFCIVVLFEVVYLC